MAGDDPLRDVVAGYDVLACEWDRWAGAVQPPLRERYVEWLEARLAEGSTVLELGSGTGHPVAVRLAARHDYLGVDGSPAMVATASRNVPSGRFLTADMRQLDLPPGALDAVVAFYSVIHVPRRDHPALFSKIRRWLRPGGYLVACLTSEDVPDGRETNWLGAGPMFWSGYDADTNERLLMEAGFRAVDASVVVQGEGADEVAFQWITAHA